MESYILNIISDTSTIHQALSRIDQMAIVGSVLFIVKNENKLVGTLTDGDIRRGLLRGVNVESSVLEVCNKSYKYILNEEQWQEKSLLNKNSFNGIVILPLIDKEGRLLKIINLNKLKISLPIDAVIMAGGKGVRLQPLTIKTPKPLLKVGDKPIIEHNIDRLKSFGIKNITISVKYLGEQIIDYFGDGKEKDLEIDYLKESKPLGTIGCLSLKSEYENDYILIMNSDLLTTIDFNSMFKEFTEAKADMIVATTSYEVDIPYGVIETNGDRVISLVEKPTYTYYANAGIYIIKKEHVSLIPDNKLFNATDLMQLLFDNGNKVIHFPIVDYWLDIGKLHDYEKALIDIKHLKI